MNAADEGFLARWARRKASVRGGEGEAKPQTALPLDTVPAAVPPSPVVGSTPAAPPGGLARPPDSDPAPLPTLDDVSTLTRHSDYSRFVRPGVDTNVKNAALKKLFSDPHFNVMDGLDTYIDDYSKPDPIPLAMLRKMNHARVLGLFDDEIEEADTKSAVAGAASPDGATPPAMAESLSSPAPAPTPEAPAGDTETPADDHADMRLQRDDAAGCPDAGSRPRS